MADPRLFDPGPKQRPDRNYDPNEWVKSPDVSWHTSTSRTPPKPSPQPVPNTWSMPQSEEHYKAGAFHTGSLRAAVERSIAPDAGPGRDYLHPYALSGQFAEPPGKFHSEAHRGLPGVWNDDVANFDPDASEYLKRGKNLRYRNELEDPGSVSFVTARPENLTTWSESTLRDPQAPRHLRALAEHYELVGKRSPQVQVGSTQQLSLPGTRAKGSPRQPIVSSPHPGGTVGMSEEETVQTTAHPVVHVLQRKY